METQKNTCVNNFFFNSESFSDHPHRRDTFYIPLLYSLLFAVCRCDKGKCGVTPDSERLLPTCRPTCELVDRWLRERALIGGLARLVLVLWWRSGQVSLQLLVLLTLLLLQ